jgi:anti-sigma B factor antagonist
MRLDEQYDGNALVIRIVDARLDASAAPFIKERIGALIATGHNRIVLDISDVEFIDSSGLSAAVWLLRRLGADGELVIGGPRGNVMSLLRLTRLDKVFRIFPSKELAVAALRE